MAKSSCLARLYASQGQVQLEVIASFFWLLTTGY
jgi:hypothetical protein